MPKICNFFFSLDTEALHTKVKQLKSKLVATSEELLTQTAQTNAVIGENRKGNEILHKREEGNLVFFILVNKLLGMLS